MKLVNICANCQLIIGAGMANRAYTIYSYGTPVLSVDCSGMKPKLVRHWNGWSMTTQRHINWAFDYMGSGHKMTKKIWNAMPIEAI